MAYFKIEQTFPFIEMQMWLLSRTPFNSQQMTTIIEICLTFSSFTTSNSPWKLSFNLDEASSISHNVIRFDLKLQQTVPNGVNGQADVTILTAVQK